MGERTLHRGDVVGSSPASSTICIQTAALMVAVFICVLVETDILKYN